MDNNKNIKKSFARIYGSAGDALIIIGILKAYWPLLLICFILGYVARALFRFPDFSISQIGIILVSSAIFCSFLLLIGDKRLKNYLKGAKGEEWVVKELSYLNADYAVFNDLRLPHSKSNFDHIIIGSTGIYIIETKNWSGHINFTSEGVFFDNKLIKVSPIKQIKGQEKDLIDFLNEQDCKTISVKSVLCFIDSQLDKPVMNVNGVIICSGDMLINIITDELNNRIDDKVRIEAEEVIKKLLV
tara:strand:+ start:19 stop:750 length:732 start_codon:yes stop_codon:yes gene_type:complete